MKVPVTIYVIQKGPLIGFFICNESFLVVVLYSSITLELSDKIFLCQLKSLVRKCMMHKEPFQRIQIVNIDLAQPRFEPGTS